MSALTEATPPAPVASAARPARAAASRDRLRHGALAVWSVLALLYLFIPVFIVIAVLVQRQPGPVQLHLAGLHPAPLGSTRSPIRTWRRR